jgi:glycosyltransferase involved in cell wall biosynthesis
MRVVVTYHSLNYEHKKWGRLARIVLRAGEWAGMTFSNGRIAVSDALAARMRRHYHTVVHSVPNGIDGTERVQTTKYLQSFGLSENRYVLSVARIDEEKRQLDLIAAYARLRNPSFKLALVGEADHSGHYARTVREVVRKSPGVMLLGYQTGQALAELYSHAAAFVLPSSNEGQPLVVLEATSFGLPVILSDIEGHREINVPGARYFPVGNIDALKVHLADAIATPVKTSITAECVQLLSRHDWRKVAQQTLAIYLEACSEAKDARSLSGDQRKRYDERFRGTHLHSGH